MANKSSKFTSFLKSFRIKCLSKKASQGLTMTNHSHTMTYSEHQAQVLENVGAVQPWIVCITAALFFFYEFVQMSMFSAINTQLIHDFHINAAQFGNLSATYFYADVLLLMPAGMILDRFSVRAIILTAMTVCVVSTIIFGLTSNFYIAMVAHGLSGGGSAF